MKDDEIFFVPENRDIRFTGRGDGNTYISTDNNPNSQEGAMGIRTFPQVTTQIHTEEETQ